MFKENLIRIRAEKGMSLYDLAKSSGVAYSVLYYIEHNGRDIRISTAQRIAKALGCKIDDLISEE